MLTRAQVDPFVRVRGDTLKVEYLTDTHGRIVPFLDRLCRLVRRLEGRSADTVREALRRQERRVRDASRLAGIARTLLEWCDMVAPFGSDQLADARVQVFRARGALWPPVPGDMNQPYEAQALVRGMTAEALQRMLYDDRPGARVLRKAPIADGRALLARYNLELARAVLRDATRVVLHARGGWRDVFRAVKAAGLMHELARDGKQYRLTLTGPAATFLARPARYGVRFARVLPVLARAPGWRVDADIIRNGTSCRFEIRGRPRATLTGAPIGGEPRRERYDSKWERRFARDFRASSWAMTAGWAMTRERSPMSVGGNVFLPDFTLHHTDGREAAVELVGFWTPEYLRAKVAKIREAGAAPLVLVVARSLAVGDAGAALADVGSDRILWCGKHPRVGDVMRIVERCARLPISRP